MRIIGCHFCGAKHIGPKTHDHPNGAPVLFGRWTGGKFPIVVKCHRCTNSMKLSVGEFHRLPVATPQELENAGLKGQLAVH